MAEVYLAEQDSLHRQVALKVLLPLLATDTTYVKRFQMEARAAAALVHPNIVQIYEVGCIDGIHYIAQEYVAGGNLQQLLSREGPPSTKLALAIIRQVGAALSKAASVSIVHRDIKPENIMLAPSGEVKVADFGLARVTTGGTTAQITQVRVTLGTPPHMSPEQVEGRPLDPRSDIYSLGVMSYQLLAGHPPFSGDTPLAVAVQHLHKEPERLELLRKDLPPAIGRFVHRMLAKHPDDRFATPRELLIELRQLSGADADQEWSDELDAETIGQLAATTASRTAATQRLAAVSRTASTTRPKRYRLGAWIGVACFMLIAGGVVAWIARDRDLLAAAGRGHSGYDDLGSAEAQYFFATEVNTIEAYRSVEQYYPENPLKTLRARQQMARLYLRDGDFAAALSLFEDLAKPARDAEFRAFGLAGQVVVFTAQKKNDRALEALEKLRLVRDHLLDTNQGILLDADMARLFQRAYLQLEGDEGVDTATDWDAFIEEHFPNVDG